MRTPIETLRVAFLPLLWLVVAGLMIRSWSNDPYDPTLVGTARYGHNHEGALVDGLEITLVELAVLLAILRPWSYARSWGRALVALALLLPWTALSMLLMMHQGGILVLHTLWLVVVVILVAGALVRSLIASDRRTA
jgi:hypothetical protein